MLQNLTDLAIRSMTAGTLYDKGRIPGFGIRAGKTRKTWFLIKDNTKVTLGHYPDVGLAEARRLALTALAAETRKASAPTFLEAVAQFKEKHAALLRPRSAYQLNRNLDRHFQWHKPLDQVTHEDVAKALDEIKAPSQRAHALKDIRTFFNWCIPRYLKFSPCAGIKKPPQKPRDRVLTDAELKAIWHATGDGKIFSNIVRLLILTGQRRGEVSAIRHSWLRENELLIPKEATKNGRQHCLPLGALAKSILKSLETSDSPRSDTFLFPARGKTETSFNGWMKSKTALDKKLGTDFKPWTLHDCRRSFATRMQRLGVRLEVTERLLNHVSGTRGGIVGIYQLYDFKDEMKSAIELYESWLLTIL